MNELSLIIPESLIASRKHSGMWQRDEIWDGVLHISPEPDLEHQDFEFCLESWLRQFWGRPRRNKVYHRINLALSGAGKDWIKNFRIPDLVLMTPARMSINHRTHFEGGPEIVVEIRSPKDESEAKLPFYTQLGSLDYRPRHKRSRPVRAHRRRLRPPGTGRRWVAPQSVHWHRDAHGPAREAGNSDFRGRLDEK